MYQYTHCFWISEMGLFKMLAMLLENQRGVKDALLYNYFPFNSFGHCIKILQDIS